MDEKTKRDFREDERVVPEELDDEFLKQPGLYFYWNDMFQKARQRFQKIELQRKIVKAELYKKYKAEMEESGKKPTEAALEAEVRTDKKYQDISEEMIDAEYDMGVLEGAKWAMVSREKTLDYFAQEAHRNQPKDTYSAGDYRKEAQERKENERENTDKEIVKKLNEKRK